MKFSRSPLQKIILSASNVKTNTVSVLLEVIWYLLLAPKESVLPTTPASQFRHGDLQRHSRCLQILSVRRVCGMIRLAFGFAEEPI
jgi:hypothetical protein